MNHSQLKSLHDSHRRANDQRYEAHSKDNLKRNVTTKFKTTMIGALVRFEETFGNLWGHGKQDHELTREEAQNRKKWNFIRTEILNNGNNQLRSALMEIDQHTVKYNKMEYQFSIRNKRELVQDE